MNGTHCPARSARASRAGQHLPSGPSVDPSLVAAILSTLDRWWTYDRVRRLAGPGLEIIEDDTARAIARVLITVHPDGWESDARLHELWARPFPGPGARTWGDALLAFQPFTGATLISCWKLFRASVAGRWLPSTLRWCADRLEEGSMNFAEVRAELARYLDDDAHSDVSDGEVHK